MKIDYNSPISFEGFGNYFKQEWNTLKYYLTDRGLLLKEVNNRVEGQKKDALIRQI